MNYTIEQPVIADALQIAKVHSQSWLDTYPNKEQGVTREYIERFISYRLSAEGLKKRELAIQQSYDDPAYFFRIARDETGKLVGFLCGHVTDGGCRLDGVYTLKDTYGTGLGKALWNAYLPQTHGNDILLTVATYNYRAKSFYKKLGFVEKPNTEGNFGDTPICVVDMIRMTR